MDQKRNSSSVDAEDKLTPLPFDRIGLPEGRATHLPNDRQNGFHIDDDSGQGARRIVRELKSILSEVIGQSDLGMTLAGQDLLLCGHLRKIQRSSLNARALLGQLPQGAGGLTRVVRTVDVGELVRRCEAGLRTLLSVDATLEIRCASSVMPARIDPISLENVLFEFAAVSLMGFESPVAIEIEVSAPCFEAGQGRQGSISLLCSAKSASESPTHSNGSKRMEFGAQRESKPIMLDTSSAAELVSTCGGSLAVDYTPGARLSLLISLPKSDGDLEELPLLDASGFLPMGTETVLVVQREPISRETICHILGAQGYTVLEAASYEEALDLASDLEPGRLVLMIADMVGSTLWGASDESESGPIGLSVRRLFTSTYVEAGADISRLTHPHEAFVESPFTPRSLLSRVREVLDRDPR
ncbi:MAG: hypothetical protein IIC83_01535 [Chloroflexi bacterium]|nr:hypothetical protein [Chloroflexota bacterium]